MLVRIEALGIGFLACFAGSRNWRWWTRLQFSRLNLYLVLGPFDFTLYSTI